MIAQDIVAQVSGTHFGVGSVPTPFVLGNIEVGSFLGIPTSLAKPERILDLYARIWQGKPCIALSLLSPQMKKPVFKHDAVSSPVSRLPPADARWVEHEYFGEGAWTYLAAGDVHHAKLFGYCEKKTGIAPTDRLIAEVMRREPYKSAKRVFWIMDNCSAHRLRGRGCGVRKYVTVIPVYSTKLATKGILDSAVARKATPSPG